MDWFEDDEFWQALYPYMFPFERFAAAQTEVEQILTLTNFTGAKVLDLCCGPGRHALEFSVAVTMLRASISRHSFCNGLRNEHSKPKSRQSW